MTSPAPDPRAARSREAILTAAWDLLARDGPAAITHQRVAQQAGVGRATVYRHWATPQDLLRDVLYTAELPFFATPAAPVRPWLHGELRRLADELALPAVASLAVAQMEQTRQSGSPHRRVTAITERLAAAFALAVDTGELDTAPDPALAAAHLLGPLLYRTTLQAAAVPDTLLAQVIDGAADWRAPDLARSRPTSAPGQPAGSNQQTKAAAQA
ncbi:MAG TPA: TetR/AcrR family transcriptional regulator [Streptosporangiaceae bacterium]